jgi:competence protein ComEC
VETSLVGAALAFGIILLTAARRSRYRPVAALVVCGVVFGAALSGIQGARCDSVSRVLQDAGAREWTGKVAADPKEGAYGARVNVALVGPPCDGVVASVRWPASAHEPEIGQAVRFRAILEPAVADEVYGRENVRAGVMASGNAWVADTVGWPTDVSGRLSRWRARANASLAEDDGSGVALLRGIALGDRRALGGSAVEQDFRVLGLSHVLAVSGMHLGLMCALAFGVSRLLRLPRRVGLLVAVVVGTCFVLVTGAPTSAVRALLMVCVGATAEAIGVRRDGIGSLAAAVIALVAASPWGVFSLGLQLSVLAVAGLLLYGRLASAWAASGAGRFARPAELMSLTIVAQVITAPVTTPAFGMFSILAPLANAIVLPCLPLALSAGVFGLLLKSGPAGGIGHAAIFVAETTLAVLAWIVARVAALPGAAVMMGGSAASLGAVIVVLGVGVWIWWPVPDSERSARVVICAAGALLVIVAVGAPVGRGASITVCDVGQGDAVLVRDHGRTLLVDAGADETSLREALARAGVRRLDAIVLTHAHDDHTGGLEGLTGVVQVGWVGLPATIEERARSDLEIIIHRLTPRGRVQVRTLRVGDSFTLGASRVEVLWPEAEHPVSDNTNDTSVVLAIHRGTFDAVLTGDAEGPVQEALAAAGALEDIEVLKVPHHGSENGLTQVGLASWRPEVAVISVGEGNRFGHPHDSALEMLMSSGARVYRTDQEGDVTIEVGERGFRVTTQRVCENVVHSRASMRASP